MGGCHIDYIQPHGTQSQWWLVLLLPLHDVLLGRINYIDSQPQLQQEQQLQLASGNGNGQEVEGGAT